MIKGLISPILSPFNDDLSFCQDLYDRLALDLLDNGCAGLAPFGTTGEALSVSSQERMAALEGLVKAGVDPAVMIPGTGLCNLPDTATLCSHAISVGCHGVMTLPPFYFKGMGDDGYFTYFSRLIDMVNDPRLKIYLYHIPQVSGVGLSIDLVARLRRAFPDVIVGIKDSSGDWANTEQLLAIEGLCVYPGSELPLLEAMALGAPGCISATANLNGERIARVIEMVMQGALDDAEAAHKEVRQIRLLFQDYAPIPAQKALLARRTGDSRWQNLRPPLTGISTDRLEALVNGLATHDMAF